MTKTVPIPEIAQFYLTAPAPCPYLEGKKERKLFTHLSGRRAQGVHQVLADTGFRRSQNLVYRPACEECHACKSARVCVNGFKFHRRYLRLEKINQDLKIRVLPPKATQEQFDLFCRYLAHRHAGGGMTQMSQEDYQDMMEDTPVSTSLVEYRLANSEKTDGKLLAVALVDNMADGFSLVYSFFDPDLKRRGLGNFVILDHIRRAARMGLPFVYLGYWVENSPKMEYKSGFRPLQIQNTRTGWQYLK